MRTRSGKNLGTMSIDAFVDLVESSRCRTRPVHCGVKAIKQPDRNQQGGNKSNRPALNDEDWFEEVRLVDENGEQKGIVSLNDALRAAEAVDLDLVEIVANAEPPVCKIMDFNKHLFDLKQKQERAKKNSIQYR